MRVEDAQVAACRAGPRPASRPVPERRSRSAPGRTASCVPETPSERRLRELGPVVDEAERRAWPAPCRAPHRRRGVGSRRGSGTAPRRPGSMISPPIVGVPALPWWPAGPSSRICWPNSLSRRYSMNFGPRNMQISSEAMPAMRISPSIGLAPSTRSRPTERDPLTARGRPACGQLLEQRAGLLGRRHRRASRRRSLRRTAAPPRPPVTSTSMPSSPRLRADLAVVALASPGPARPSRRAPRSGARRALPPGDRGRRASTSGWRCSSRSRP